MQLKCNRKSYRQILGALCLFLGFSGNAAIAGGMYMNPGDSKSIQVQQNVDTIFIASPDIADYEMIGEKTIVIYAKGEGRTELIAFNNKNEPIYKTTLIVDSILSNIYSQIKQSFPDSEVTVQKMGKTYIISGTAASEEAKDGIYQIVGEGTGAEKVINKKQVTDVSESQVSSSGGGGSGGGSSGATNSWLDEIVYNGVINKLELPVTNQVNVKLTVVEVTKSFTDNVGIDWGTITGGIGNPSPGLFRFVKFNADTLSGLVHAISNDSVARVLAEPNLSVMSGETAEFLVGGEVPLVTSSSNGSNVEYKDFGIKLNIGAKVKDRKKIRISLGQEVSSIDADFVLEGGTSLPSFQTRRAKTTVELADGESFVIGGLINNSEREALSRVPFIGDVPLLGALFRNAITERSRKELVVVATVRLVKPVTSRDIVLPDIRRTSTWARFFNLTNIDDIRDKQRAQRFIDEGGFIK